MKVLLYTSSFLLPYYNASLVVLEEAEHLAKASHEVHLVTCGGALSRCFMNQNGNKGVCQLCQFERRKYFKKIDNRIQIHFLMEFASFKNEFIFDYQTSGEIKEINYKGVEVGYAVMSTYITSFRNPDPLITPMTKPFFDSLIYETIKLTDYFETAIKSIKPDQISFFNGRVIDSKPINDIAIANNIPFTAYEVVGGYGKKYKRYHFKNGSAFDPVFIKKQADIAWENKSLLIDKKIEIGKQFFDDRRNRKPTGDKIYTRNQEIGLLPKNWNIRLKNIVIFNSSEDEFASVGNDFDKYKIFNTQLDGIKFMINAFSSHNDYHFYLRIHPNLSGVSFRYHNDLKQLDREHNNITVIHADDKVSTYDLMDHANLIVVFGSTTGVEATYWGKPVILIGPAIYREFDICYKPETPKELIEMIENFQILKPKSQLDAIRYIYYNTTSFDGSDFKYFNVDYIVTNIAGVEFRRINGQMLLGSGLLYSIYFKFIYKTVSLIGKLLGGIKKFSIPVDEA
jgi:hypothetical protein